MVPAPWFHINDGTGNKRLTINPANGNLLLTGILEQDTWHFNDIAGVRLEPTWQPYGAGYNQPGFFKDTQGIVHLRGMVKSAANPSAGPIFYLPPGYRPAGRELHATLSNNESARIDIFPANGAVQFVAFSPTRDQQGNIVPDTVAGRWVSLDGISFRAAT
jgi:hypothetical protein